MRRKTLAIVMLTLTSSAARSQQGADSIRTASSTLAFASDTQAPMWVETLWLKANNNRKATGMVFSNIREQKPRSLFLLGDVVNLGYSNRQWKPIDRHLEHLRENEISVSAILGNHEVMGRARKGQKKFQQRFPNHVATGYVQVEDSIAIVMLNSNFARLSKEENEQQVAWYNATLEKLDADSSIQHIITACHHSPFTNSRIVKPCTDVQQKFVPPYLRSAKSRLFLSGHCHGFEHYQHGGKDFMVIGGGGGLHQPLRTGTGSFKDLAADYKPLFHYLTVQRLNGGLQVTSYRINSDFSGFETGLQLSIRPVQTQLVAKQPAALQEAAGN